MKTDQNESRSQIDSTKRNSHHGGTAAIRGSRLDGNRFGLRTGGCGNFMIFRIYMTTRVWGVIFGAMGLLGEELQLGDDGIGSGDEGTFHSRF